MEHRRISRLGRAEPTASSNGWSMTIALLRDYMKRYAHDPRDLDAYKASSPDHLRSLYLSTYDAFTRDERLRIASASDTIYARRPMLHTLPEIRLLKIHQQREDAQPRCSTVFWTFPLSASIYHFSPYYTLSYRWSSPTPGTFLNVDGIDMNVSDDLILALRMALRQVPAGAPLVIWVDAICINQNSDLERGFQVNIMNHIYSASRGSFIWLGPDEDGSGKAMDLIAEVAREHDSWFERLTQTRQFTRPLPVPLELSQPHRNALAPLLSRSYWERLWIVQEVLLSPQKLILCGDRRVDWVEFQKFLGHQSLHPNEEILPILKTVGASAANLEQIDGFFNVRGRSSDTHLGLLDALSISRSRKCTDPRDHVYAVLGITRTSIAPDYKKDTSWIWTMAALVAIEEDKSLNVLSLCQTAPVDEEASNNETEPALPSWVPNLAQARSLTSHICLGGPTGTKNKFQVFGPRQTPQNTPLGIVQAWSSTLSPGCSPRLRVAACVVDKVKYCHTSTQRGDILRAWQHWSSYLGDTASPLAVSYESIQGRAAEFTDVILMHQPKQPGDKTDGGRVPMARPWILSHLEQTGPESPEPMLGLHHPDRPDLEMAVLQPLRVYLDAVHADLTIFYTEAGRIGMGVRGIEVGDEVCLVGGCDVSLVLRKAERSNGDGGADISLEDAFPIRSSTSRRHAEGLSADDGSPDYLVVGECCECLKLPRLQPLS